MKALAAPLTVEQYFLEARSKLLDLAAFLDRIHRGESTSAAVTDARVKKIEKALEVLLEKSGVDRAARIQEIFSQEYDPQWKKPSPR